MAGVTVGSADLMTKIHHKMNHLGGSLDTHACFLLQRGLKTLEVRMQRHCENAMALARHLANHPKVKSVIYPGLENLDLNQCAGIFGIGVLLSNN